MTPLCIASEITSAADKERAAVRHRQHRDEIMESLAGPMRERCGTSERQSLARTALDTAFDLMVQECGPLEACSRASALQGRLMRGFGVRRRRAA